jgi:hypothetical protein
MQGTRDDSCLSVMRKRHITIKEKRRQFRRKRLFELLLFLVLLAVVVAAGIYLGLNFRD